jgi:glycosyltransferase involved in cell wall biosynthesis
VTAAVALPSASGAESQSARPLVSVVMPVYNGGHFLVESLESVLAQTYPRVEVVVVDDASEDETPLVLERYAAGGRIRYLRNAHNLGQFASVNVGIGAARGDLIAIQHADDKQLPPLLEREVEALEEHPRAGAAFALDILIDPSGHEYRRVHLPQPFAGGGVFDYRQILDGVLRYGNVFLRAPTSLVRRDVYEQVGGFSERWGLRGDIDMWLRIARAHPIVILDEHLTRYRWGHANVSASYERLRTDPELTFALLDETIGSVHVPVAGAALAAFEARRAEDLLIVTANRYVLDDPSGAREVLGRIDVRAILRSGYVRRPRLIVLWLALGVLCKLPRSARIADVFYRRWGKGR